VGCLGWYNCCDGGHFADAVYPKTVPVHKVSLLDGVMDIVEEIVSINVMFPQDNLSDARHYYLPLVMPQLCGIAYSFVTQLDDSWTKISSREEDKHAVMDVLYVCLN
jgi:hypothetical protein